MILHDRLICQDDMSQKIMNEKNVRISISEIEAMIPTYYDITDGHRGS